VTLLPEHDRQTIRARLDGITHPVTLLFFSQSIGAPDSSVLARRIADEIADLSDKIAVEEVSFVLDKDRVAAYGIQGIPAIALLTESQDARIAFLGAPAGYEFVSLVEAVVLAGTDDSGLGEESKKLIDTHVSAPIEILVFVTPTCPHCPRAVALAHRMAAQSPHIRATCVEATEFYDLSQQYRVTGVPKTIVNGKIEILGAIPEDEFVRTVLGLPERRLADADPGR
jgi:glutaredoxin-like protein